MPVLGLRLGFGDESTFAEDTTTRQAYELLADGFGPGTNGPLLVVAEISDPSQLAAAQQLVAVLNETEGIAQALGPIPSENGKAFQIFVIPTTGPQQAETSTLVENLRADVIPNAVAGSELDVKVTGSVASSIDFSNYLSKRLPVFFVAVLSLSFLLLMMVFRSVLVPLKAVIMNLLSIGGAYGLLVAVFQWGWGVELLGTASGPIEPFLPMMLFAIVFGLSMDYEVFLLSRVREEYDRTGDAVNSVADGLAATARVITAAAAIMVVVFGSFVLEDARVIKMFGLGLASAVLLDATLVRMLLVPATMELLGERNWWLPKWLDRILPTLNVEGHALDDEVPDVGQGGSTRPRTRRRVTVCRAPQAPARAQARVDECVRRSRSGDAVAGSSSDDDVDHAAGHDDDLLRGRAVDRRDHLLVGERRRLERWQRSASAATSMWPRTLPLTCTGTSIVSSTSSAGSATGKST